jgi:5'-3' exonuclease
VKVHLVDGTYELFRSYYGAPQALSPAGREVGATRGLLRSLLALLGEDGVSHVACAFDHVIESFRNDLFPGYKTGDGLPPDLLSQFELAERAVAALGIVVWPMVEFEADDAIATAAVRWAGADGVDQVVICSPDKDFAQCVKGTRVVRLDRRRRSVIDEDGVLAKYGVPPSAIPDWLALVGDAADGIPGIPGWGEKSAAHVLRHFGRIEDIPDDPACWPPGLRSCGTLAACLAERRSDLALYKTLATLRTDVPQPEALPDLAWRGARRSELHALACELGDDELMERVRRFDE